MQCPGLFEVLGVIPTFPSGVVVLCQGALAAGINLKVSQKGFRFPWDLRMLGVRRSKLLCPGASLISHGRAMGLGLVKSRSPPRRGNGLEFGLH